MLRRNYFVYTRCFKWKTVKQQRKHKSMRVKTHLALSTVIILTLQTFVVNIQANVNPPSPPRLPSFTDWAKNLRGNFTHPADLALLLLIAGWSSISPKREAVITSLAGALSFWLQLWLMKKVEAGKKKKGGRKKRQILVCPRYKHLLWPCPPPFLSTLV